VKRTVSGLRAWLLQRLSAVVMLAFIVSALLRCIASLSQRIESLVHELDRQSLGSGRARLVDYLVRRAGSASGPRLVTLPATKAAIASQLNLTPEHFSRLLHELAAAGLVQLKGRQITVPDVHRLAGSAPGFTRSKDARALLCPPSRARRAGPR
jgi:CRP-like cAMP-binding protein